jgi:hypothetical protein
MVLTREKVLQGMNELPKEFSIDELLERLILLQKIEIGFQQVKEGNTISHAEVKKTLKCI